MVAWSVFSVYGALALSGFGALVASETSLDARATILPPAQTASPFGVPPLQQPAPAIAEQPHYGPPPSWATPLEPVVPPTVGDQPLRVLLADRQVHFDADGTETYVQVALRAQSPQALQAIGNISREWDPQTETLTINKVQILRDGTVIDVLAPKSAGGKSRTFNVLRREQNLERSMLDGRLTAALQLEDLRVGDVVVFAMTVSHHDPSFKGRPEANFSEVNGITSDHIYLHAVWPKGMKVRWRTTQGMGDPKVTQGKSEVDLVVDMIDAKPPNPPKMASARFADLGRLQISAYPAWTDVSRSLAPLFVQAAEIPAGSSLQQEAQRIRGLSKDRAVQASAALRLVEEKVRYLFLNDDLGGYKPVAADVTWQRRFGDCKGKTVLLAGLLRQLGLDADPVLVSTTHGDGMQDRLPSLEGFDHAIVRLRLDGRIYWLDATRTGDLDLAHVHPPGFQWALPITAAGSTLVAIEQPPFEAPQKVLSLSLDARGGLTAPAPAHGELLIRGDAAEGIDLMMRQATKADLETSERQLWRREFPWITIKRVSSTYDPATGEARQIMDGVAQMDWRSDDSALGRRFLLGLASVGSHVDFKRDPDTRQDAPYSVGYPDYDASHESLLLPNQGLGYRLEGRDIDRIVGATRFRRTVQIKDGAVVADVSTDALAREFPANQMLTAQMGLNTLASEAVWVRAPVDYNLSKQELAGASALDPKTTEDFYRRGNEMLAKMELDKAIADFDEVIRREPAMAPALLERGQAWRGKGDLAKALADFDASLAAQPDDLAALYARSQARLEAGHRDLALADADLAVRYAPNFTGPYNNRAALYQRMGKPDQAIIDFDASLKLNPDGYVALAGRARAYRAVGREDLAKVDLRTLGEGANSLNERCFGRAASDVDLDAALIDCNAAIALAPAAANIYDSRGFLHFRRGEMPDAVADLTTALKLNPRLAESLFVRGLAKRKLGDKPGGDADVAAAKALDATVVRSFEDYGVRE